MLGQQNLCLKQSLSMKLNFFVEFSAKCFYWTTCFETLSEMQILGIVALIKVISNEQNQDKFVALIEIARKLQPCRQEKRKMIRRSHQLL